MREGRSSGWGGARGGTWPRHTYPAEVEEELATSAVVQHKEELAVRL